MANRESRAWKTALWLGSGAVIGAGVGLLLAPRPGKETRRDLARFAKKAGREAEGFVEDFSDAMGGILDRGKDLAFEAKKELRKTIDEAQETLEKQRMRLTKLVG